MLGAMKSFLKFSRIALVCCAVTGGALLAQAPAVVRTVVERADISVPGREAVIVRVEFPVGATTGKHTHFGEEISYVMEGEGELMIEGQPAKKLTPGVGFIVPNGAKHEARNTGSGVMKIVAVFPVEKGKPLTTPVQ